MTSVEEIERGIEQAIFHGHPEWSHVIANGPCTRTDFPAGWEAYKQENQYQEMFETKRKKSKHERLSVSLPTELVTYTREVAVREKIPLSAVIEIAIRVMRTNEINAQIIEGLMEDAFSSIENKTIKIT